ncbi:MAG: hypothetical protein OD817_06480 [Gammaproteobacteria bacterium]
MKSAEIGENARAAGKKNRREIARILDIAYGVLYDLQSRLTGVPRARCGSQRKSVNRRANVMQITRRRIFQVVFVFFSNPRGNTL